MKIPTHSQVSEDDYALKALQNKNWANFIKTLLEVSIDQVDISSFLNPNELSIISQTSEILHICKEYYNSQYHNVAGCFQEYLTGLPDLFVGKMEDDIIINLVSNTDPAEIFKIFDTCFIKSGRFSAVIPHGSIASFVRVEYFLSLFELYEFFNQTDAHGFVYVQFSAALNSHIGGEKNISKKVMSEFLQNLFLQALNELDVITIT